MLRKLLAPIVALLMLAAPPLAFAQVGPQATGMTQSVVSVQLAVTAASAYASGNVVGTLLTFNGAGRATPQTGSLQKVELQFQSAQTAQFDLYLFDSLPSNSTFTDKTALSIAAADLGKWIGTVHIADCTSGGTPSECQYNSPPISFKTRASGTLYGVLVTRGTPTFAATTDAMLYAQFSQD